jgi:hypothetical protein
MSPSPVTETFISSARRSRKGEPSAASSSFTPSISAPCRRRVASSIPFAIGRPFEWSVTAV